MKKLAILATVVAAGVSLAACSKEPAADNAVVTNDITATDLDAGNETLTDENVLATENLAAPLEANVSENATGGNAL